VRDHGVEVAGGDRQPIALEVMRSAIGLQPPPRPSELSAIGEVQLRHTTAPPPSK
jgi:hypothetical protein